MSTFYTEDLSGAPIETAIRIDKNVNIKHIRPYIYMNESLPNGQLVLSLLDGATLLKEVEIDFTVLNAITTDDYLHGFIRFDMDTVLNHKTENTFTEYIIKIEMKNYTASGNVIALVTDLNDKIVPVHDVSEFEFIRGFQLYKQTIF